MPSTSACTSTGRPSRKLLREIPRNDDAHLCVAVVQRARQLGIALHHARNVKVFARLKVLEQVLALLAAVLIEHINRQSLEIEIDAVAEEQHQHRRHQDDNHQAARVAQNLQAPLCAPRPAGESGSWLALLAASRSVVSETKTSSRLGRIFSMRLTAMPRSAR